MRMKRPFRAGPPNSAVSITEVVQHRVRIYLRQRMARLLASANMATTWKRPNKHHLADCGTRRIWFHRVRRPCCQHENVFCGCTSSSPHMGVLASANDMVKGHFHQRFIFKE